MRLHVLILGVAILLGLALLACGQPATTPTPTATSTPVPTPTATRTPAPTSTPTPTPTLVLKTGNHAVLGRIVTDIGGRVLYIFDRDTAGVSNCNGSCLVAWPPLVAPSGAIGRSSEITANVDVITRTDGSKQITFNGLPLYYYRNDTTPGDAKGAGVNGVWWVVSADGSKVATSLQPAPTPTATVVAPAATPTSVSQAKPVNIASFAFAPASLTVPVGTTVTWTNQDSVTHTVTADNGAFGSGGLARGQSFSYTFTVPGTYAYHCTAHPNMKGTVTVTQSGTPSSTDGTSSGGMSDYY